MWGTQPEKPKSAVTSIIELTSRIFFLKKTWLWTACHNSFEEEAWYRLNKEVQNFIINGIRLLFYYYYLFTYIMSAQSLMAISNQNKWTQQFDDNCRQLNNTQLRLSGNEPSSNN